MEKCNLKFKKGMNFKINLSQPLNQTIKSVFIFIYFISFLPFFRGACPCSVDKTCADPNQSCNCDVMENKWYTDEGSYSEPHSLGITNMYFIQQKDLDDEAQGRITLGPLECVETSKSIELNSISLLLH